MHKKTVYQFYFLIFSTLHLLLFFIGFLLDENSSGGSKSDFLLHDFNVVRLFKENSIIDSIASIEYDSSRTPLFFIVTKFIPFVVDQYSQRVYSFVFSIFVFFLFYIALTLREVKLDKSLIFFASTLILMIPTFRGPAYWGQPENFAYIFIMLSIIFLLGSKYFLKKNQYFSIFFSYLAFYCDQKFLIFPILFSVVNIDFKNYFSKKNTNLFLANFFFLIPYFYLIYIWGSFFPKPVNNLYAEQSFNLKINFENVSRVISIFFVTFIPVIILKYRLIIDNLKNCNNYDLFILLIFITLITFNIPDLSYKLGGGFVSKFFYFFELVFQLGFVSQLIYIILIWIFSILIYFLLKGNIYNYLPIIFFILLSLMMPNVFREYIDPLNFILICFFYTFSNSRIIIDKKFLIYFQIYYYFIFSVSLIYYHKLIVF